MPIWSPEPCFGTLVGFADDWRRGIQRSRALSTAITKRPMFKLRQEDVLGPNCRIRRCSDQSLQRVAEPNIEERPPGKLLPSAYKVVSHCIVKWMG